MIRLFKVFVPTSVVALLFSEAAIIMGSYILTLYWLMVPEYDPAYFLIEEHGLWRICLVSVFILLGIYFNDLYANIRIRHRVELLQQLCISIGAAFLCQALISYLNRAWTIPKWMMIEGSSIILVALFVWRLLFHVTVGRSSGQRILFLGQAPIVFQVAAHLAEHPELGFRPIGFLDEPKVSRGEGESALQCLGSAIDLIQVARAQHPDQVVVGMSERRERMPAAELLELRFSGIKIDEIARLYEITFGRVCVREIRPSELIFTEDLGPKRTKRLLQSLYSRVLALAGLIVVAPVMLLVAIAIRLTSPGPILFRQRRVGLHEKVFTVFKFRSMYQDAESRTGPIWATRNDPRITPLGNWLRKSRLDELPQLFNVIRGDMSIVGPRPERPEFVDLLTAKIPFYRQRHAVMPGITGWAQINYKYGDTIEDTIVKLEYDLYYIKHVSAWLDFYIMFHTVKTMLLYRGAQ